MFYPPPTRFDSHLFENPIKCAAVGYDFATHGGDIGAIVLPGILPDDAIVMGGFYEVLTTFTSATDAATVALHLESANDIKSAVAISNGANPWDAGIVAIVPVWTAATAKKLTAERNLTLTVAVEDLTAGKLVCYMFYVLRREYRYPA